MVLTALSNNSKILLENMFTWALYAAAVATAMMPIFQALAFIAAFSVSVLTGIKLLKDLFGLKKNKDDSQDKKG
jgi:hypothetical protein